MDPLVNCDNGLVGPTHTPTSQSCWFAHRYHIPSEWLQNKFQELGLDTYVQNYSFKYPGGILQGKVRYCLC